MHTSTNDRSRDGERRTRKKGGSLPERRVVSGSNSGKPEVDKAPQQLLAAVSRWGCRNRRVVRVAVITGIRQKQKREEDAYRKTDPALISKLKSATASFGRCTLVGNSGKAPEVADRQRRSKAGGLLAGEPWGAPELGISPLRASVLGDPKAPRFLTYERSPTLRVAEHLFLHSAKRHPPIYLVTCVPCDCCSPSRKTTIRHQRREESSRRRPPCCCYCFWLEKKKNSGYVTDRSPNHFLETHNPQYAFSLEHPHPPGSVGVRSSSRSSRSEISGILRVMLTLNSSSDILGIFRGLKSSTAISGYLPLFMPALNWSNVQPKERDERADPIGPATIYQIAPRTNPIKHRVYDAIRRLRGRSSLLVEELVILGFPDTPKSTINDGNEAFSFFRAMPPVGSIVDDFGNGAEGEEIDIAPFENPHQHLIGKRAGSKDVVAGVSAIGAQRT
ncbi:hypothetical protein LXL04_004364 [Taraxacum kok-saghyz]